MSLDWADLDAVTSLRPRTWAYIALYDLVDQERGDLRTVVHWLALGAVLGAKVLQAPLSDPSSQEMAALSVLITAKNKALLPLFGELLVWAPSHARHAVSIQILVDAGEWSHPLEVLEQPRPRPGELFEAFNRRRLEGDESPEFLSVGHRLEKLARIEESARLRRLKAE